MATNNVQFSHSVVSDSLWPHESQHARPPYPSQTPRDYSNLCPSSQWCHPAISSSVVPFSSCPQSFPASGSFPNELALLIRWPKYWSFSFNISPSREHPGLISFRMDWLDLLAVQATLKSLLQHYSSKASILLRSAFFTIQLSQSIESKKEVQNRTLEGREAHGAEKRMKQVTVETLLSRWTWKNRVSQKKEKINTVNVKKEFKYDKE